MANSRVAGITLLVLGLLWSLVGSSTTQPRSAPEPVTASTAAAVRWVQLQGSLADARSPVKLRLHFPDLPRDIELASSQITPEGTFSGRFQLPEQPLRVVVTAEDNRGYRASGENFLPARVGFLQLSPLRLAPSPQEPLPALELVTPASPRTLERGGEVYPLPPPLPQRGPGGRSR